ncbi:MAG: response regulator [Hyphomicrobiaceae bacterium]
MSTTALDDAPHILVVDDDDRIRQLLARYLVDHGFRVTPTESAEAARAAMRGLAFDLVLLDVMMPGESGLSLARDLRNSSSVPICLLTANSEPMQRIEGLEIGVDDYISKPFDPRELVLRLRNILRRTSGEVNAQKDEIAMGPYRFNVTRGELRHGDEVIKLTDRERELMRIFAARPGMTIQRHELAADDATGAQRTIDVQITRLRRKFEKDPSNPTYLQTVRGKGYVLYID